MPSLIVCPSGLAGEIRGLTGREGKLLADRTLARSGATVDRILQSCWLKTTDPGVYDLALTNPLGTLTSYVDLLMNLWDRDYVVQHQTMAAWFTDMHAYPGGIVQDFVVRVGMDNALSKGRVPLGKGQEALLDRVDDSLLAIAGTGDKIVTVEAARKVMDIVASADKHFALAPGGHAGVFAGSQAPATTWKLAADFLATRSA
jgi:polyhydroxyalkanoate synthase